MEKKETPRAVTSWAVIRPGAASAVALVSSREIATGICESLNSGKPLGSRFMVQPWAISGETFLPAGRSMFQIKTLEQFRETCRIMTAPDFGELVGDSSWQDKPETLFRVYAESFYIEILQDGRHMLTIENNGWIEPETSLSELESILFDFALTA